MAGYGYFGETDSVFPRPGAKLRYKGTSIFWFTNIIANAERELRIGGIYTMRTLQLASSWAKITLEETGDVPYELSFFEEVPASENT